MRDADRLHDRPDRRGIRAAFALSLMAELSGCSMNTVENFASDAKELMKAHGLEVQHGKLLHVTRF